MYIQYLTTTKVFFTMNSPVPACTTFMKRCTMLVYRNWRFCICSVHTRIYTLRMPVAGGQLSCGILPFSCTDITVHGLSMYRRWHTLLYAFWGKRPRKADHLPQASLGCIYAYVHCIYRTADSCTLAWYSASWRRYRRVRTACLKEILWITLVLHVHGMKQDERGWNMYRHLYTLYSQCTDTYIENKVIFLHVDVHTC
jgi:hypothetical protein